MALPRLIIVGASGVIGRHLIALARPDYDITVVTRRIDGSEMPGTTLMTWNPRAAKEGDEATLEALAVTLEGAQAVVNLAGAPVSRGRLGSRHRRLVLDSRLDSTTTLSIALGRCKRPPRAWFQTSGSNYYGDRGDDELSESEPAGDDFGAGVTVAWEKAAAPIALHTRLTLGRTALVVAADAPAWQLFLLPIRLFVGGRLGSGRQFLPWIEADDTARAILFLIETDTATGPYNLAAPEPVRQRALTRAAARRLRRPALLPLPAFLLRIVLGDLADALLLPSQRVVPSRLMAAGFSFAYPEIDGALDRVLGS